MTLRESTHQGWTSAGHETFGAISTKAEILRKKQPEYREVSYLSYVNWKFKIKRYNFKELLVFAID